MLNFVIKSLGKMRDWAVDRLSSRIYWLRTSGDVPTVSSLGSGVGVDAKVLVVGPEFFSIRRKQYPISSWWQARNVVLLELGEQSNVLFTIGPWVNGSREVLIYELQLPASIGVGSVWALLPETEALRRAFPGQTLEVHRSELVYFLHPSGLSHVASGLVSTSTAFRISQGLDSTTPILPLRGDDQVRAAIESGLRNILLPDWFVFFQRQQWNHARDLAVRISTWVAAVWLIFQVATVIYLHTAGQIRATRLDSLGSEVSELIARQATIEKSRSRLNDVTALMRNRELTVAIWQLDVPVRLQGGVTYGLAIKDGVTTLRGQAPNATEIVSEVSKIPGVSSAKIESTTMIGPAKEDFVVNAKVRFGGVDQ